MAATQIKFPRHSFVNDSTVDTIGQFCDKPPFCLPAAFLSDWRFQVFITEYGDQPNEEANLRRFYVGITDQECTGSMPMNVRYLSSNILNHYDISDNPITLPDGTVVKGILNLNFALNTAIEFKYQEFEDDEWGNIITEPIDIGECFRLTIWEDIIAEDTEDTVIQRTALGCTNCFVKVAAEPLCFWSRFNYRNNENSHGFLYNVFVGSPTTGSYVTFTNHGFLPFHLHSPSFPSEEKSYTKSNGSHLKLYERTDEQFTLETDYFDMRVHKCMKVMLGSDSVGITNDYFGQRESSNVICKDSYDLEWDTLGSAVERLAKATTKVISQTPISLINTNCE